MPVTLQPTSLKYKNSNGVFQNATAIQGESPVVAVTDITNGHRITITDAEGTHSFDVMDGNAADAPVQDVQINGTSVLSNGIANVPMASTSELGTVKVNRGFGIMINPTTGDITVAPASSAEAKSGAEVYKPITPIRQHETTFYGLAKAAGDTTQSASSNTVGTYTNEAKAAINTMIGSVSKESLKNAGISAQTYTEKFNGEFTVTTATTSGWLNPYARASVTGRISKHYMHRVTFNGTEYILPTRLWYNADSTGIKVYEYLGNLGLYISDISGVPEGTDNVPFVIISDLNNSNSIDVLTQTAGTYTILVEQINNTQIELPKSLIWKDSYVPIEKNNNGGTYNGYSIGVNELLNTRATGAIGYGNKISSEFSYAIGTLNEIIGSGDKDYAIGDKNTVYSGTAIGMENTVNSGYAIGIENDLSGGIGIGYGLKTNGSEVALGQYNVMPNEINYINWQSNTEYHIGDHVLAKPIPQLPAPARFVCLVDHTSSSAFSTDYQANKWEVTTETSDTRFLIGIGASVIERKNGLKIDTSGRSYFYNDIYVKCEADSTGGTKVATVEDVPDIQINGTSIVNNGVANVPLASTTQFGVVKVGSGLNVYDNKLYTSKATSSTVKAGTGQNMVIVPYNQHESTFYGLAKAAGADMASSSNAIGTYTNAAKSAISEMLNGAVTVTGTTPTITALPGIRYVCGEVATLDITLPASGIVDVVFESGSTATVLTITPPTGVTLKWANSFDPSSLDANTTYEVNIADGLGVAATWS